VAKFKVGDRVVLVDHPGWRLHRQYIGLVTTVLAEPRAESYSYNGFKCSAGFYVVEAPGAPASDKTTITNLFAVRDEAMRRLDDGDDFAEPRDMSDDTPNKITTWGAVPWKPTKEVIK
jgi:hypothetical protein